MKLYKAEAMDTHGPFCGKGGYGTAVGVAMHRSAKRAVELAKARMREDFNRQVKSSESGHLGGGVPVFDMLTVWDHRGNIVHSGDVYSRQW